MPQPVLQAGLLSAPHSIGIELPVDDVGRIIPSSAIEAIDRHANGCRCLAIGPGFGCGWEQQQIIATLIARDDRPIILDADGLNALALLPSAQLDLRAPIVMTPHVGEYRRLAKAMGTNIESPEELAQVYGCVLVLKSDTTQVFDGVRTTKITEGGVELATGGSGDVLTGIIAGLVAGYGIDGVSHVYDAAVLGAIIHARCGKSFASEHGNTGMLATDLLKRIPDVIATLRT